MCRLILIALVGCSFQGNGQVPDAGTVDDLDLDASELPSDASLSNCAGIAATCGPSGDDDCCSSAEAISGGTFYRSYDVAADGMHTDMSHPATVSSFVLDKYEVTVGRFRKFVAAGMGTQATAPAPGSGARRLNGMAAQGGWDSSWDGLLSTNTTTLKAAVKCNANAQSWTDLPGANEALPMNCITWFEANAFCISDGGFLPTDTEWSYVAAGGSEQRAYPWSSPPGTLAIDCSYTNYNNGTAYCANPPNGATRDVGSESPNGDGRWGHADLGGNVWEWTLDSFQSTYPNPCTDCANLASSTQRQFRGGSFLSPASDLRTAIRYEYAPALRGPNVGVRCARALP